MTSQPKNVTVDRMLEQIAEARTVTVRGKVISFRDLVIRATVPGVRLGQEGVILRTQGEPLPVSVIGFEEETALLYALGDTHGIGPGNLVEIHRDEATCGVSMALLGRIIDGLGVPIDGLGPLAQEVELWPIERAAPAPLMRPRIDRVFSVGIRAIDGLLTLGVGQRVGLFSGAGVGKSMLLGQIARGCDADAVVVCLVGERGREVREFVEECLGEGLRRAVVVCATSDEPALVRMRAVYVATTIAEYLREQGLHALLVVDSVTRYARAVRDVALAAGELPVRRGFPPSVFSRLPRLIERAGRDERGTITAIYTVLTEGDDLDDPLSDEIRGLLDGHIVLRRSLASQGHFPAIDIVQSLSRLMSKLLDERQRSAAQQFREWLALYEEHRDLLMIGGYQRGTHPRLDDAIAHLDTMMRFLRQPQTSYSTLDETQAALITLTATGSGR